MIPVQPWVHFGINQSVQHVATAGGIENPVGVIVRERRLNSLTGTYCYGVKFPHGYYQVDEELLMAINE